MFNWAVVFVVKPFFVLVAMVYYVELNIVSINIKNTKTIKNSSKNIITCDVIIHT